MVYFDLVLSHDTKFQKRCGMSKQKINRRKVHILIGTGSLSELKLKLVHTSVTGIKRAPRMSLQQNRE
jgi:hypothetical protein